MKENILLLTLLLIFNITGSIAQSTILDPAKGKKEFKAKFDIRANAGISIPVGRFRTLTDESNGGGAAGLGGYGEIMTSMTPLPSSPWRISLTLGYMHNPFESEKSKEFYKLPIFEGTSWNSFYTMLGVGFLSKSRLFYGINFSVGVLAYTGGNIRSGQIVNDTMELSTWTYDLKASLAIKADATLGYQITHQFSLFTIVSLYYAAGVRDGTVLEEEFLTDLQSSILYPNVNEQSLSFANQTTIFTINIGIGFRYKFYEESKSFNYKFNLEENQ